MTLNINPNDLALLRAVRSMARLTSPAADAAFPEHAPSGEKLLRLARRGWLSVQVWASRGRPNEYQLSPKTRRYFEGEDRPMGQIALPRRINVLEGHYAGEKAAYVRPEGLRAYAIPSKGLGA